MTTPDLFDVKRKKKREKVPSKYPGAIQRLIGAYVGLYERRFQAKPLFTQKDGAILKRLINEYGPDKVFTRLEYFMGWKDEWVQQTGYTIGVFQSKWMALDALFEQQRQRRLQSVQCSTHEPKCLTAAEHSRKTLQEMRASTSASSRTTLKPSEPF